MWKNIIIIICQWIIYILDKLSNKSSDKFLHSYSNDSDIQILTPHGWDQFLLIHEINMSDSYTLITQNGETLVCADKHRVFNGEDYVYVEDMKIGDNISTIKGVDKISSIYKNYLPTRMGDITVSSADKSLYTDNIVSHNTTTSALFMLWYILFNVDKGALVLGDKRATAVEILDKMKKIFRELPYFLKPGVVKWNEGEISFDNGCRIMAQATTQNSGIGFTFHCVLADEFAHVDPNMVRKFYSQIFPTVTASKAKFMITSTQNGRNLFYKLYKAAEAHESDYAAFKVDWWQIPEWDPTNHKWIPRDDEWKSKQIANLGSEEDFNMQFGTDFDIGAPTLLNQKYIKSLEAPAFIYKDMLGVTSSSSWYWHPDLDIYDLKNMKLVVTSDLAEQVGEDYTIFEVYRLVNPLAGAKGKLQLMGYFRDNTSSREVCAQSLVEFLNKYTDSDATIVSFEKNTYGDIFYRDVKDFCDDHDIEYPRFVKYAATGSNKKNPGIKITPGNKSDHCKLFKEAFEKGQIQCNCEQWILESYNFVEDNGSYKASYGHDDLMMAAIQLTFVEESTEYTVLLDQPDPVEARNQALLEDKEYIDNPIDSRFKGQIIARNIISSADQIHNSSWIQGKSYTLSS